MKKRTIFIGDIHGCYDEFKALINKIKLKNKDKVYLVGDLINKGPKSFKVIKYLYKNREQFTSVLGNHDLAFLKWLEGGVFLDYGKKAFKKLKIKLEENPEILEYYKKLPLYIEKKDFLLIHAGLHPNKLLEEQKPEELTNIRVIKNKAWYDFYKGEKKIIYGHWAAQGVNIRKNVVGLDSGCCYGGYLSAYILESGELIQVGSMGQYSQIDYSHINPVFQ